MIYCQNSVTIPLWMWKGYTGIGINDVQYWNNSYYISTSLYGNGARYYDMLEKNIIGAAFIYPGWIFRLYHGEEVNEIVLENAKKVAKTYHVKFETVLRRKDYYPSNARGNIEGMFWRFEIADDPNVDAFIVRDIDSILSIREREAVNQWLASKYNFHTLHDNPFHNVAILGGMWGAKKGTFPPNFMTKSTKEWTKKSGKGADQTFLRAKIYPLIRNDMLNHDHKKCLSSTKNEYTIPHQPFPTERYNSIFIGGVGLTHSLRKLDKEKELKCEQYKK